MQLTFNKSEFNNLIISYIRESSLLPKTDIGIDDAEWLYFLEIINKTGVLSKIRNTNSFDIKANTKVDIKRIINGLDNKNKITLIS